MWDGFYLVINEGVPKGAKATPYAMMPKVLCCITGEKATVYKGREVIRRFQHFENGVKKATKLFLNEEKKAYSIFNKITKNRPIILNDKRV